MGRFLVDKFWGALGGEMQQLNGYDTDAELKKLQPYHAAFWYASGLSIHNYDQDLFKMVKQGKINAHIADVERLTKNIVHLTDGTDLKTDVLVCATGWRKESSVRFLNFGTAGIGLPQTPTEQAKLATDADKKILEMYPRLRDQPALKSKLKSAPYRLYRFTVRILMAKSFSNFETCHHSSAYFWRV